MFEGQAGIKNRTSSAAGSNALARFGGRGRNWSSFGENRVEIRRSAVDYFGHGGKTLSVSGDAVSMGCTSLRSFWRALQP